MELSESTTVNKDGFAFSMKCIAHNRYLLVVGCRDNGLYLFFNSEEQLKTFWNKLFFEIISVYLTLETVLECLFVAALEIKSVKHRDNLLKELARCL